MPIRAGGDILRPSLDGGFQHGVGIRRRRRVADGADAVELKATVSPRAPPFFEKIDRRSLGGAVAVVGQRLTMMATPKGPRPS